MEMITNYEVEGSWTTKKVKSKCRYCGALQELVPETGHYNSKYWELKRNDGLNLFCCPHGCSVIVANNKMHYFINFSYYMVDSSQSYNYKLDYSKIKCGWIDRKGIIYPCYNREHRYIAEEILNSTQDKIEKEGYVLLTIEINKYVNNYRVVCTKKVSKLQINTILYWAHANNLKTKDFYDTCMNSGELWFLFEKTTNTKEK